MKLSNKALEDLRRVLINEIGSEVVGNMTDEDLSQIGELLLTIAAESLKIKIREEKAKQMN